MAILTKNKNYREDVYFGTPVWILEKPEWVEQVNKVCDKHIIDAVERDKPKIEERKQKWGEETFNKQYDIGHS